MAATTKGASGGGTGWTNPSNAFGTTTNTTYATATPAKSASVTGDFTFPAITNADIPDGAHIDSVVINVDWKMNSSVTGGVLGVQGLKGGVLDSAAEVTQTAIAEAVAAFTFGTTPLLSDIRAGTLAARLRCAKGNTNTALTGSVDYVSLTVNYTVFTESGTESFSLTVTGTELKAHDYTDGVGGAVALTASGTEFTAHEYSDTAVMPLALTAPAVENVGLVDAQTASAVLTPSGTDSADYISAGVTVTILSISGSDVDEPIDIANEQQALTPIGTELIETVDSVVENFDFTISDIELSDIVDQAIAELTLEPQYQAGQFEGIDAATVDFSVLPGSDSDFAGFTEALATVDIIIAGGAEEFAGFTEATVPVNLIIAGAAEDFEGFNEGTVALSVIFIIEVEEYDPFFDALTVPLTLTYTPLVQIAYDDFNRVDSVTLGPNWTDSFNSDGATISGNKAASKGSSLSGSYRTAESYANDQYSQATIGDTVASGQWVGVTVRQATRDSGYLMIAFNNNPNLEVRVYRFDPDGGGAGGVNFTQLQGVSSPLSVGDVIRLEVQGNTLSPKLNGVAAGSPVTDSTYASGHPGIQFFINSASPDTLDDWQGGNIVSGADIYIPSAGAVTTDTATVGLALTPSTPPGTTYEAYLETPPDIYSGMPDNNNPTVFGISNATTGPNGKLAQQIVVPSNCTIRAIHTGLGKVGTPTDQLVLELRQDSAGDPTGTLVATQTVSPANMPTSGGTPRQYTWTFPNLLNLLAGTYWLVAYRNGATDASNSYRWYMGYKTAGLVHKVWNGSTAWSVETTPLDLDFGLRFTSQPTDLFIALTPSVVEAFTGVETTTASLSLTPQTIEVLEATETATEYLSLVPSAIEVVELTDVTTASLKLTPSGAEVYFRPPTGLGPMRVKGRISVISRYGGRIRGGDVGAKVDTRWKARL